MGGPSPIGTGPPGVATTASPTGQGAPIRRYGKVLRAGTGKAPRTHGRFLRETAARGAALGLAASPKTATSDRNHGGTGATGAGDVLVKAVRLPDA